MTYEFVPFGGVEYFIYLAALLFARGMDMLSTRIATPNLISEGNPVAKWLGWRGGIIVNLIFSSALAVWPMPAIVTSVMSALVAARNFQSAWLMRTMGEERYAAHIHEQLVATKSGLFTFCIGAQSFLFALIGLAVALFTPVESIAFAVGCGIAGFGALNLFFSMLSLWRNRGG